MNSHEVSPVTLLKTFRLARERGCRFQMSLFDERMVYWLESQQFVSKPYYQPDDLLDLLHKLPAVAQDSQPTAICA